MYVSPIEDGPVRCRQPPRLSDAADSVVRFYVARSLHQSPSRFSHFKVMLKGHDTRVNGVHNGSIMKNQPTASSKLVFLRPSRVAEILDISRTSVYDLIKAGELTGIIRVGSRLRIPQRAVDEMVQ